MVASRSIAVGKHGRGNDDIYSNVIIRSSKTVYRRAWMLYEHRRGIRTRNEQGSVPT